MSVEIQPKAICIGSINIDHVFSVPDIALSGQTISSSSYQRMAGGKGANQSVALAKAGLTVTMVGKIGSDGEWILNLLSSHGVVTSSIVTDDACSTGSAMIQVSRETGDNAIVLNGGTNHQINHDQINNVVYMFGRGDLAVFQNEINTDAAGYTMRSCSSRGLIICLNPSPCPSDLCKTLPVDLVDILIVNSHELDSMVNQLCNSPKTIPVTPIDNGNRIMNALPNMSLLIVTLGNNGSFCLIASQYVQEDAVLVQEPVRIRPNVIDTTGAGDTFLGYFLGMLARHLALTNHENNDTTTSIKDRIRMLKKDQIQECLRYANTAAGLCCEHEGAMSSIPSKSQVDDAFKL